MRFITGLMVFMSLGFHAPAWSQSREVWEEFGKRVERSRTVASLGDDLLGDRVGLSDGSLSFAVTDAGVSGNNGLPIDFSRTYSVKDRYLLPTDLPLADWDIDVPNISGVFAQDWLTSSPTAPNQRCSITNRWYALPKQPTPNYGGYRPDEYWQGYHLNIPGVGGGELLLADAGTTRPSTGGPYYWLAGDQIYVSCLNSVQNGSGNGAGEGFLALAPDGTRYWFDRMAQYQEQPLGRGSSMIQRKRNVLYASRVEDRFGNWVTYTYTNAWNAPARLTRIEASDGRLITIGYNAQGNIASVTEGARTWQYQYTTLSGGRRTLSAVIQPDGSQWSIGFSALTNISLVYPVLPTQDPLTTDPEPMRDCFSLLEPGPPHQFTASATHPSGVTGQFTLHLMKHGRSNVPISCSGVTTRLPGLPGNQNNTNNDVNFTPISYLGLTLVSKTLAGPGVAAQQWTYGYVPGISVYLRPGMTARYPVCPVGVDCSQPVCTSDACAGSSLTTVTGPDGTWTRYTHGNSYRYNEGKLLKVEKGVGSTVLQATVHTYDLSQTNQQYPARYGISAREHPEGFQSTYVRPLRRTDTVLQGETFTWEVATGCAGGTYCFDAFARPTRVTKSSTVP